MTTKEPLPPEKSPKNKKCCLVFLLLVGSHWLLPQETKITIRTIFLPDPIKAETNPGREVVVSNLSDQRIYKAAALYLIDDSIYLANPAPAQIIKLSLQGEILRRTPGDGKEKGPLHSIGGIRPYEWDIGVLDLDSWKILVFNKKLEFIKGISLKKTKYKTAFRDFFLNNKNELVLYGSIYGSMFFSYYFTVCAENGGFIRHFAESLTNIFQNMKIMFFDAVHCIHYIPGENGIWACFKNRYDLRFYRDETMAIEIKAPPGYFKGVQQAFGEKERILYQDRALYLAVSDDRLYYFFLKGGAAPPTQEDGGIFCDIYDLKDFHLRRVALKYYYSSFCHYKDNIFYGLGYDITTGPDLFLYRLEL